MAKSDLGRTWSLTGDKDEAQLSVIDNHQIDMGNTLNIMVFEVLLIVLVEVLSLLS